MLLRSLPDFSQTDVESQNRFLAQWGRDNCIVWGRTQRTEFGPYTHTLSIRAAWGGVERCHLGSRTVAVDDDNFLILNHGRIYATSIQARQPVESLWICFRPELVEQVHGAATESIEQALVRGDGSYERSLEFSENLQPHEKMVSPVLRFIRAHMELGIEDETWYEEQMIFLLARMRSHREQVREQVERLTLIRSATRREVHRRIALATDFLHTNYARDVNLGTLAKVAFLSKYHFLRLFRLVHGTTPGLYLQRKRVGVAIRLLESTELPMREIAFHVGFGEEATLTRHMRRIAQLTPRQVRARATHNRLLSA